jgi:cyclophilin family peptidyl-prolyl cis-trans isomerase
MRTLALSALLATAAFAAKPVFEVPEAAGYDRVLITVGITNDTAEDLKIEKGVCEGLTVKDATGKALTMKECPDLAGLVIGPWETVTRRVNLARCFPDVAACGNFDVAWAHPLFKDSNLSAKLEVVDRYAVIELEDWGTIVLRFYPDKAPRTVDNFQKLTEKGFYNNLVFHRIMKGFMMQGGCPRGDGTGDAGYKFEDEKSGIQHKRFVVSMANSGPNTNGSQFFICFDPAPHLDTKHTTFGKVMEGQDVVMKVERDVKVVNSERPIRPPRMKSVTWHQKK